MFLHGDSKCSDPDHHRLLAPRFPLIGVDLVDRLVNFVSAHLLMMSK